jgi:sterol desaturase/sphingolipid hydroxylase (fatty acid hydroxylase superfamily)
MLHGTSEFLLALAQETVGYFNFSRIQNPSILLGTLILAMVMLLAVLLVELYYVGWQKSGLRRLTCRPSRSAVIDIVMYFLYISGAISLLAFASSLGIPQFIKATAYRAMGLELGFHLHPLVHLAVYLVTLDLFNYWKHRIFHRYPTLWHIHSFHHAATEFTTMTVLREHPLDKALQSFSTLIPAILLGVPTAEYPFFITVYGIFGYIKHSQIPWRWGWFGKYVIQSPVDHWIHHSNQPEHYDKNFSAVFAIWDHLFGTYYSGDKINSRIGLDDAPFNQGVARDMVTAQALFMRSIFVRKAYPSPAV